MNAPYTRTHVRNYNIRANAEPFPDMRIELNANKNVTRNNTEYFRWDRVNETYIRETPMETGTFSMSFITWRTAFKKADKDDHTSEVFQKFLDYRPTISSRIGQKNPFSYPTSTGYWYGYSETSQDVLIPAFLAAYSGKGANSITLKTFPAIPLPNWRVTYDGFIKIPFLKKYFRTFTLSHAYRSTYNVGSYTTNLRFFDPDGDGFTNIQDLTSPNFISQRNTASVSISEQFSPLVKVEMTWNNSLTTNVELKKDRNVSLGLTSLQILEINGREIIVGAGYRINKVPFPFKIGSRKLESDLNLRADVSIRNNQTAERRIIEKVNRLTSGQNVITIKVAGDYMISDKLNLRLFYDRIINKPVTSLSFPTSNTNAGISLRFTLSQ
jgi:cell surface protein SprA